MIKTKATLVWLFLLALTLFTFSIGRLGWISEARHGMMIFLVLATTLIKGSMVSEYFMELHSVRTFWRIIPLIYLLLVVLLISLFY